MIGLCLLLIVGVVSLRSLVDVVLVLGSRNLTVEGVCWGRNGERGVFFVVCLFKISVHVLCCGNFSCCFVVL